SIVTSGIWWRRRRCRKVRAMRIHRLLLATSFFLGIASAAPAPLRDGRHDFDFNVGVWHTQIKRFLHPFAQSPEPVEMNGLVIVRTLWDGRAELEEIEVDGPKGHWEGLTLFLYDPQAHEWSQTFINSAHGAFGGDALVGTFHDGRGELYAHDTFEGRSIFVR